ALCLYLEAAAKHIAKPHHSSKKSNPPFIVMLTSKMRDTEEALLNSSPSLVEKNTNIPNAIESRYVKIMNTLIAKAIAKKNLCSWEDRSLVILIH
ncbi:MAG: hypothetical protein JSV64_05715, partial [Candidatus Bathyarchaeota archaeon]